MFTLGKKLCWITCWKCNWMKKVRVFFGFEKRQLQVCWKILKYLFVFRFIVSNLVKNILTPLVWTIYTCCSFFCIWMLIFEMLIVVGCIQSWGLNLFYFLTKIDFLWKDVIFTDWNFIFAINSTVYSSSTWKAASVNCCSSLFYLASLS